MASVSRDGLSYSPYLFKQASDILLEAGNYQLFADLQIVEEKVHQAEHDFKLEEELFCDAPEKYIDPILSCLMRDPVRINSRQIVDRSTIGE